MNPGEIHLAPGVGSLGPNAPREFEDFFRDPPPALSHGLRLVRFTSASLRERWRARFTNPRSTSLAEREWNLACHLRAHGVGAPQPIAVGRGEGAVFAERSFVVFSVPDGLKPLDAWMRDVTDESAREHLARALDLALGRLSDSGTFLPGLRASNVLVGVPRSLAAGGGPEHDPRLRWGDVPEVVFTELRGGRILRNVSGERQAKVRRAIEADLARP